MGKVTIKNLKIAHTASESNINIKRMLNLFNIDNQSKNKNIKVYSNHAKEYNIN